MTLYDTKLQSCSSVIGTIVVLTLKIFLALWYPQTQLHSQLICNLVLLVCTVSQSHTHIQLHCNASDPLQFMWPQCNSETIAYFELINASPTRACQRAIACHAVFRMQKIQNVWVFHFRLENLSSNQKRKQEANFE